MSQPKIIVCGGRNYADAATVRNVLGQVDPILVIHGAAKGGDSLAGWWAKANGVNCIAMPAEWDKHGPSAGPKRNSSMLSRLLEWDGPHLVVAFPGGRGTADMCRKAKAAGVDTLEIGP